MRQPNIGTQPPPITSGLTSTVLTNGTIHTEHQEARDNPPNPVDQAINALTNLVNLLNLLNPQPTPTEGNPT